MFDVCFYIFRTFEPSAFAGFRGSSCCIFRAFGVSGFRFSWVSGFWPSGFRVFDACFPACKLSGFLPFMFSSFRLSFFRPFSGTIDCLFEIRFGELCFAVVCLFFSGNSKQPFLPVQQPFLPVQQPFFPMPTAIFEIAPFMFAFVDVCLSRDVLISRIRPRNPMRKRFLLSLRWAQWPCLEVLARLRA